MWTTDTFPGDLVNLSVFSYCVLWQCLYYDKCNIRVGADIIRLMRLRIDNSGWSVNSSTLFDVGGMRWYQRKYHVLHIIRQPIINSIY